MSDERTSRLAPRAEASKRLRNELLVQNDSSDYSDALATDIEAVLDELEELRKRIVTVDIDGRKIKMDNLAECEAALATVEGAYDRLHTFAEELRHGAYGSGDRVSVKRDAYAALIREVGYGDDA